DLGAALAVPGVLDILTYQNVGKLHEVKFGAGGGGAGTSIQELGPEIAHDGQIIAVVVADTFEASREAARRVQVAYVVESASATFGATGLTYEDATTVSEQHKKLPNAGDVAGALAGADITIDAEYATATEHHNPIELFSTSCVWTDDQLTIL